MDSKNTRLPWYLRNTPFFIISLVFVPISLIILMVKSKEMEKELLSDRAFMAFLFSIIFVLNLLPKNGVTISISILFYLFTGILLILKFTKED